MFCVSMNRVHFSIRLDDDRPRTLVMIGARPEDRRNCSRSRTVYREVAENSRWCCASSTGAECSHQFLAVGEGALGFWAAARKVWAETRWQCCRRSLLALT